ncbi:hypothetical protein QYM36_009464 [Artemia franciscana]|uniref:Reverse transcriptase/retrotransposon-derived protein RNase H-like domain-containing protein n=1 Tax=Artemia franciscana TaxID=6661 RepID=A0AA88I1P1_ARTSF|nr:hypothetical protein QYM36_009464 [Artemia franciscana]
MDAQIGYWSMELNKPSSELTTFKTMYSRYKWNQYPFRLISPQDKHQQKMEEVFRELDIGLIVDDIVANGRSDAEHDDKLRAVLQATRDKGVRFNKEKCVFNTTSITYFRHRLTTSSIIPDPEETQALENMPTPQNQEELQALLGMYNYLSRYIPSLATLNKPFRDLSKQQKFDWNASQEEAKRGIQNTISKNLPYFDPEATDTEVITDTSQYGLGVQLSTYRATITFASRSLIETEQHYSQMERDARNNLCLQKISPVSVQKNNLHDHGPQAS